MRIAKFFRSVEQSAVDTTELAGEMSARERIGQEGEDAVRAAQTEQLSGAESSLTPSWRNKKLPLLPRKRSLSLTGNEEAMGRRPGAPPRSIQTAPQQPLYSSDAQAESLLADVVTTLSPIGRAATCLARARQPSAHAPLEPLMTQVARLRADVARLVELGKTTYFNSTKRRVIDELRGACKHFLPPDLASWQDLSEAQANRLGTFATIVMMAEQRYLGLR